MSLQPGTRLGPYEIQSAIGAGGMGEVFRARDTRLDRVVAIKILPASLAGDPQFQERFDREARVISSLSHPHVCPLFDVGEESGVRFLVMEHLDGETLEARLAKGPLPVGEALTLAIQVASALAAAHRAGIVHRDLKPGNVMLTKSGAKLLDFGLAKNGSPAIGASGTMLPTTPASMTAQGTILGTFQYMAPEQIEGMEADPRTDIFAFGAVLYEMLTGKKAFVGKTRASLLGAILKDEPPPVSQVLPVVPAALNRIVATCLAKDPDDRWQTARDLMRELQWVADGGPAATVVDGAATQPAVRVPRWPRAVVAAAYVLAGIGAAAAAFWTVAKLTPAPKLQPMRFAIVPSVAQPLSISTNDRSIDVSPDGTHIVFLAPSGQLMVRAIDQLEAEPLRGITGARAPFFSPDGKWVGFFQGTTELKKVSVSGGPAITLCRTGTAPRGASWGPDDTIVFATSDTTKGLFSVPAGGGDPKVLTKPDAAHGELDHLFPSVLPGGRAVLFTITATGPIDNAQVAVLDLKTGQPKTLVRGGSHAQYVDTGHLVYAMGGTLRAVRFDPVRLEVIGDAVPVAEQVMMVVTGAAQFSVSRTGALVYVPGGAAGASGPPRSLVWVGRNGREDPINAPPRAYQHPRLSPDGTRLAVDIGDQENDVWVWDFAHSNLTRLTFDPRADMHPAWTPDGRRIVFVSNRAGVPNVFSQQADGTGAAERLTTSANNQFVPSMSPDGTQIVVTEQMPKTGNDLTLVHVGKPQSEPLVSTTFAEALAEISPDGHWLAYVSDEAGRYEIFVRPFPNVSGGRWQVSPSGGNRPAWARSGKELFYGALDGSIMVVPVQTGASFSYGNAVKLFEWRTLAAPGPGRTYDVSRDGQRFLMVKEAAGDNTTGAASSNIVVVLNWTEELKARVPVK